MYAELKHCQDAYLVYPVSVSFEQQVGRIRVRGLTFSIAGDLEENGHIFLDELYPRLVRSRSVG
jgi:hypothetical protein